ncbi:chitin deacetylase [Nowakowskiella sp. JEL0078]|nr:chitin deacetylase [Nowakowskiella sp. JEL0078]
MAHLQIRNDLHGTGLSTMAKKNVNFYFLYHLSQVMHFLAVSAVAAASVFMSVNAQPPTPPPKPAAFPPATQLQYISGSYLTDPLVVTAYDYVVKTVRADLLNLQPSFQNDFGNVTYPTAQITSACHWGIENQCTRAADTADFKADVLTCPGAAQWGLTYDDGPVVNTGGSGTPEVLTALQSANLKATFFVLGVSTSLFPAQLKAAYAAGHDIAIHTWTHRPMTNLTNIQLVAELKYTERLIYETIGVVPAFVRPPYGDIDDRVRAIISALGYRTVIWTTAPDIIRDTQDTITAYQTGGVSALLANVTKWFTDTTTQNRGFISLEHDAFNFTASLAVAILNAFKTSNSFLKPMPIATCLSVSPYKTIANATTNGTSTVPVITTSVSTTTITTAKPSSTNSGNHITVSKIVALIAVFVALMTLA